MIWRSHLAREARRQRFKIKFKIKFKISRRLACEGHLEDGGDQPTVTHVVTREDLGGREWLVLGLGLGSVTLRSRLMFPALIKALINDQTLIKALIK